MFNLHLLQGHNHIMKPWEANETYEGAYATYRVQIKCKKIYVKVVYFHSRAFLAL